MVLFKSYSSIEIPDEIPAIASLNLKTDFVLEDSFVGTTIQKDVYNS